MTLETATSRHGLFAEYRLLVGGGWRMLRAAGWRLIGLLLATQLIIALVALPALGWLFRQALRAGGMRGLDLEALPSLTGLPITLLLLVVVVLLAFWLIALQFTSIVVLLRWPGLGARAFCAELGRVARQLMRPGSLPLIAYLFLLLPLSGFGFTSALAQGIAIPSFISGELLKSTSSTVALTLLLITLAWLNLRLALTVPTFVLSTGRRSARASWRLTRGLRSPAALVLTVTTVTLAAGVAGLALLITAIAPTAITDAVWPSASPVVAAFSLAIAQIVGAVIAGLATAWVAGALISRVELARAEAPALLPEQVTFVPDPTRAPAPRAPQVTAPHPAAADEPASTRAAAAAAPEAAGSRGSGARAAVLISAGVLAVALGALSIAPLTQLAGAPSSLVLAHRGFSGGGVENTIGGLDAAKRVGADLVEMDVMQTKDGEFVAMHDAHLGRLAGIDAAVKDLTLDEITQVEVRDQFGHADTVPSFADYVTHAAEIDMPLLIEIKLGGADTPDHVEQLVAELETLGLLENNIYHSLDRASVAALKRLRPDLTVGYTMAFAGGDVPSTPADFIVVEEWTATESMQQAAEGAGLGFFTWTVNEEPGIRAHLRRGTDGIITDHPDIAVAARAEMGHETGLADVLVDALTRFVTVV
ncbi:glycerophosphoryl diester phosphodiesterase membrane domain-containing protein [Leucobacter sp. HY1910]